MGGNSHPVPLTYHEFFTLAYLALHPDWVFSKEQIYEAIFKENCIRLEGRQWRGYRECGMQRAIGMSTGILYKTFLWEGAYYGMIEAVIGNVVGYI